MNIETRLREELADLACQGLARRRSLLQSLCGPQAEVEGRKMLAFASNDYLGLAAQIKAAFAPLAGHPRVRHLRQQGMILASDVDSSDPAFSRRFYRAALAQEALVRPMGNTVYVMPPYIVSPEEITHLAQAVAGALDAALADTD